MLISEGSRTQGSNKREAEKVGQTDRQCEVMLSAHSRLSQKHIRAPTVYDLLTPALETLKPCLSGI